jgi:NAD(P)-dependent dehydrogenase (short-subunit alcohol dehydrogenase family)
MPRLAGKTIVIIGAGADGAGPLAQRLALLGAQIIAIGPLEAPLLPLARLHPEKIEVLAMDFHDLAACRRLARLWGREPVHGLINLMPLAAPVEPAQLALETVVTIMRPALMAGQGAVVCLAPAPAPATAPVGAGAGAHARLAAVAFAAHQQHMALLAQARAAQGITVAMVALAPGLALAASAPLLAFLSAAPRPNLGGLCFPLRCGAQSD